MADGGTHAGATQLSSEGCIQSGLITVRRSMAASMHACAGSRPHLAACVPCVGGCCPGGVYVRASEPCRGWLASWAAARVCCEASCKDGACSLARSAACSAAIMRTCTLQQIYSGRSHPEATATPRSRGDNNRSACPEPCTPFVCLAARCCKADVPFAWGGASHVL